MRMEKVDPIEFEGQMLYWESLPTIPMQATLQNFSVGEPEPSMQQSSAQFQEQQQKKYDCFIIPGPPNSMHKFQCSLCQNLDNSNVMLDAHKNVMDHLTGGRHKKNVERKNAEEHQSVNPVEGVASPLLQSQQQQFGNLEELLDNLHITNP